jgi:hypothetical protein
MGKGFGTITYIDITDFTWVKCDVITPPAPPCQGGVTAGNPNSQVLGG